MYRVFRKRTEKHSIFQTISKLLTNTRTTEQFFTRWLLPYHTVLGGGNPQTLCIMGRAAPSPAHRWWSSLSVPRRCHSIKGTAQDRCHQTPQPAQNTEREERNYNGVSEADSVSLQATCSLHSFCVRTNCLIATWHEVLVIEMWLHKKRDLYVFTERRREGQNNCRALTLKLPHRIIDKTGDKENEQNII